MTPQEALRLVVARAGEESAAACMAYEDTGRYLIGLGDLETLGGLEVYTVEKETGAVEYVEQPAHVDLIDKMVRIEPPHRPASDDHFS